MYDFTNSPKLDFNCCMFKVHLSQTKNRQHVGILQSFLCHVLRRVSWVLTNFKLDIFTNIYINIVLISLAFKALFWT